MNKIRCALCGETFKSRRAGFRHLWFQRCVERSTRCPSCNEPILWFNLGEHLGFCRRCDRQFGLQLYLEELHLEESQKVPLLTLR